MAIFVIYRDKADLYRWRLIARNGEIVAVSEAYASRHNAKRSAERVRELAPNAEIVDKTIEGLVIKLLNKRLE